MPDPDKKDPLFGVAILKVSVEMRGGGLGVYDGIIKDTCDDLGVKEKEVDRYIKKHRARLEEICRERGLA